MVASAVVSALFQIGPEQATAAIPTLGAIINDPNGHFATRSAACDLLAAMGEPAKAAIPNLALALKANHNWVRRAAGRALATIDPRPDITPEQVAQAIAQVEVSFSRAGTDQSSVPGGEQKVKGLIAELSSEQVNVRRRAAQSLREMGLPASAAVPALAQALRDEDASVRRAATGALGRMGEAAVPALSEALTVPDEEVRFAATDSLRQLGYRASTAVPALVKTAANDTTRVRLGALRALGEMRTNTQPALAALVAALKVPELRLQAVQSIGRMESGAAEAVPKLVDLLDDPDKKILKATLRALAEIEMGAEAAAPRLAEFLDHEDQSIRYGALYALSHMWSAARPAAEALIRALDDPVDANRQEAAYALGQIHACNCRPKGYSEARAVPKLTELVEDSSVGVREYAVYALGWIGADSAPALSVLLRALHDHSRKVRNQRRLRRQQRRRVRRIALPRSFRR